MYGVAIAVILLPLLGLLGSYLAETRRGVAAVLLFTTWLTVLAAVILLGAVVAGGRVVHSDSFTFWSFDITQTPFHAAPKTLLAETFEVGLGYAASPTAAVLALLVSLASLLAQLQLAIQFRRDPRLGQLVRLCSLLTLGALLLVLAAELFQVLIGFEICGLAAALLIASARGSSAGGLARSGYLIWRAGAMSLLLGVAFIYVKFSGPVAIAAASAAAAAAKHKATLPTPDGLSLSALGPVFSSVGRGLVHGVGGRSLTLAAVLLLVAAVCACGQLPWHSQARHLGSAPGAAAGLVLAVAGGVVGTGLLLQSFPLLRWASGVLPALVVLATLTSLVAAGLALREHRLRRLAVWLALSQTALALVGLGLGAPVAALAVLISSTLATVALMGVVSSLARQQRVETIGQLGAAWRLARPTTVLLLAALLAISGVLGLGTFFGHVAVLAAAFGAAPPGAPAVPELFSRIAAAGEIAAMVLLCAAAARVGLIAVRGEEAADPREARLVRRQLAQGAGLRPLWPSATATVLALLSGLVSLPGVRFELGSFLAPRASTTALPWQAGAFLVVLLVPLLVLLGLTLLRARLGAAGAAEPAWLGWAEGTRLAVSGDALGMGLPGWAVRVAQTGGLETLGDAASAGVAELAGIPPPPGRGWMRWRLGSGVAALAGLAFAIAILVWASGHPGAGMP